MRSLFYIISLNIYLFLHQNFKSTLLIDTHTHLYAEAFDNDREEVITAALNAGVSKFYLPAIDSSYVQKMYAIEKKFPQAIRLMAGLHPTHVKENVEEELNKVKIQLQKRNFSAIGEIGIDLFWDRTYIKEQQDAFSIQIEWAKQYKLPIVIHCRDAFEEVFEVLESHKDDQLFGIFHCFAGTEEQAFRAIALQFKLGIGGVITFKNGKIDKFLHRLPIESIVLETDAPYLAPIPHRGKRNESAYLPIICNKVAECYGISIGEIEEITNQNAYAVFGK